MRLLLASVIIAAVSWSAAASVSGARVPTRIGHLHRQSHSRALPHSLRKQAGIAHGFAKTAAPMKWVETGSANFVYSTSAKAWSLDFRDTSIYDSHGRLWVVKTSIANAGWGIDSLCEIDSTVWSGSRPLEYDSLFFNGGVLDSADCVRWTMGYNADRTVFTETKYVMGPTAWIAAALDSLVCALPITDPTFINYNDSSRFISLRTYALDGASGALKLVSASTKIDVESNAARLAILCLTAGSAGMDSSKMYETINATTRVITADSVAVKSASGAWVASSRASNTSSAAGDWMFRKQLFQNGAWTTSDSVVLFSDGSGYEICRPEPGSLETYVWDACGYDTLEVTMDETDTMYWHCINTYDGNGNLVKEIGYTTDKSGSNKIKTDSSAFTYAQIPISSVRFSRSAPAAKGFSFIQTPTMLRVTGADITNLRLFDLSGRMIASVNQPSASAISIVWNNLKTHPGRQLSMAQVATGNGTVTRLVLSGR